MNEKIPIPPRSVVRIRKLWPHARKQGHEKGDIWRVGYYCPQDGLDCVWLVDHKGEYNWTTDHQWLYEHFEAIAYSDETDFYGDDRPFLGPIDPNADPVAGSKSVTSLRSSTT